MNHQNDHTPQPDDDHDDEPPIEGDAPPVDEYRLTTHPHDDQQT